MASFLAIGIEKCTHGIMPHWATQYPATGAQQVVPQYLISSGPADLKDEEEDMNDVNVERERSVHVLLWTDCLLPVSDKKLSVVD